MKQINLESGNLTKVIREIEKDKTFTIAPNNFKGNSAYEIRGTINTPSLEEMAKISPGAADFLRNNVPIAMLMPSGRGYVATIIIDPEIHYKDNPADMAVVKEVVGRVVEIIEQYATQ